MQTTAVRLKKLGWVRIQPLRKGDTQTVSRLFDRLFSRSRVCRSNETKPRHTERELPTLACVDARSYSLVAWVEGDPEPAGFAQIVHDSGDWTRGHISFAVVDDYRGLGIGSALVDQLAADARAAGITHLTAVSRNSSAPVSVLVERVARPVDVRFEEDEASVDAALSAA